MNIWVCGQSPYIFGVSTHHSSKVVRKERQRRDQTFIVGFHWGPAEVVSRVRIRSCCLLIGWGSYRTEREREEEEKTFIFQFTVDCC